MSKEKRIDRERLHRLDGLRGWAALTVAMGHLTFDIYPFNKLLLTPFTDTRFAVGIFFILSGFVLSYRFIGCLIKLGDFLKTLIARYIRLTIPIAVVTFIVLIGLNFSFMHNVEANLLESKWHYENFYQFNPSFLDAIKFAFVDVYFRYDYHHTYIPPSWTMPMELMGSYLIYTLLFIVGIYNYWNKRKIFILLIALLAILVNIIHFNYGPFFLYGYLLAIYYKNNNVDGDNIRFTVLISKLGFVLFILMLAISSLRSSQRPLLLLPVMSFTAVWSVLYSRKLAAFFSNKISLFLGKISFPLYLIHVPIYCSFSSWFLVWLYSLGLTQCQIYCFVYICSLSMAIVCAYCLCPMERFAINVGRYISKLSWHRFNNLFTGRLKMGME